MNRCQTLLSVSSCADMAGWTVGAGAARVFKFQDFIGSVERLSWVWAWQILLATSSTRFEAWSSFLSVTTRLGPGRHCLPRHPTHFEPSYIVDRCCPPLTRLQVERMAPEL